MKKLLSSALLLLTALAVRADVTIEQNMESAIVNGSIVSKIKGDLMRVDSPMPGGAGQMTTILDLSKGKSTVLMHAQKMAMEVDLSDALKQAQTAAKDPAAKPKATGKTEKVGQWNTEIYEITSAGVTSKLWSAKDFPNAAALKEQMMKITKAVAGKGFDPAQFDVPGMPVKTQLNMPQGVVTSTIVSVKEGDIPASEFVIPADYQKMSMPALGK